jgi:glucose-1-phosphate cytidylyltransferase
LQAVILAGGLGTRISEQSHLKPKPMIEIGGFPILWHILKTYSTYGINEFIICCGYKGYLIKEYFSNYFLHNSDVTIELSTNALQVHTKNAEPWKITLIDTGLNTMTGGRIKRVADYIKGTFCLTYGDGLCDINISDLIKFHQKGGKLATLTAVQPEARFGALEILGTQVEGFSEKPKGDGMWINGGFFVCEPKVIEIIEDDTTVWEQGPLSSLSKAKQLEAFKHRGFWQPMDTLRDHMLLERLWDNNNAKWKVW